jgi:radical SAM protein with 4Fe4S-binding SPASM domain
LLRKDLERLMGVGTDAGVSSYSVATNGRFCTAKRAKGLRAAGLDVAMVSIDGADANDHCAVRACAPEDFEHALKAIGRLQDAGVWVSIAMILTRRNLERIDEVVALCERMHVTELRTCTFLPTGRAALLEDEHRSRFELDADALQRWWQKANELTDSGVVTISQDHGVGPWNRTRSLRCSAGRGVAYVDTLGDVYPCPGLLLPAFVVGNIATTEIGALLASDGMTRVHAIERSELLGRCGQCGYEACSGGCRGAAHSFTGDVHGEVPYCLCYVHRDEMPTRRVLRVSDDRLRELGKKSGILKDESD